MAEGGLARTPPNNAGKFRGGLSCSRPGQHESGASESAVMCSAAMGDGRGGRLSIGDGMGWFGAVAMDGGWWMDSTQSTREEGMYWPWDGRGAGCWLLGHGCESGRGFTFPIAQQANR